MWLKVLSFLLVAVLSYAAMAKQSLCEDPDAAVYSLSDAADEKLRGWLNTKAEGSELSLVIGKHAPDTHSLHMSCSPDSFLFDDESARLNITRRCRAGSGRVIAYRFSFLVCEKKEVPVAISAIPRLSDVSSGQVGYVSRRVAYSAKARMVLAEVGDVYRTTRAVREGSILNGGNLELRPLVERKRAVTIRFGGRGFQLELPGVALLDGWAGDVIRVRNKVNGSVLDAKVESAGVVRIDG